MPSRRRASKDWASRRTARRSAATERWASVHSSSATSNTRPNPACSKRCSTQRSRSSSIFGTPSPGPASSSPSMAEILVAAVSARALAGAARNAGFRPLAADLFGDLDLKEIAEASIRIDGDLDSGIRWTALIAAIEALAADRDPVGLVYGSGFEDRPVMLERLTERWKIFGNSAATVARAKDPAKLAEICGRLAIPHPRWSCEKPAAGWLHKLRGGAGGAHIQLGASVPPPRSG